MKITNFMMKFVSNAQIMEVFKNLFISKNPLNNRLRIYIVIYDVITGRLRLIETFRK
ncbi:MAG: hypothetical protein ACUVQ1_01920 [Candidatus Kapaibacteriales bacterium]